MTEPIVLTSRVRPAQDVLFRDLDGEAVLLGLASSSYFGLDPVGTRMWHLLVAHERVERVLDAVVEEFAVERATAERDLLDLLRELHREGLVVLEGP